MNQQAAQQIGALLTQAGIPAGHASDIAQRLLIATSPASTSTTSITNQRLLDATSARSLDLQNQFRPAETPARSIRGKAGKDGLKGNSGLNGIGFTGATGATGADGKDGAAGADGIVDYSSVYDIVIGILGGNRPGGKPFDPTAIWREIAKLTQNIDGLRNQLKKLEADMKAADKKLQGQIDAIKKKLEDTVECKQA